MVEAAPAGMGLEWTRGPAPGAAANHCIQRCNDGAGSACFSRAHIPRLEEGCQGRGGFHYRVPPAWSPEYEASYSFRAWCQDLSLWVMLTDLEPHPQVSTIVMRLGGAAREMVRGIAPQELAAGGAMHGVQYDPASYILDGLQQRFAQLGDESRLVAMTSCSPFIGVEVKASMSAFTL